MAATPSPRTIQTSETYRLRPVEGRDATMPLGTDKRMMELFDLVDCKGFDVVKSTMKDHVRLIGPDDEAVKNDKGGATHSYAEARRFLEALPDRNKLGGGQ